MENSNKFVYSQPFRLEGGSVLPSFELAYTTYGKINPAKDNVVWVCHALTGNSEAASWWDGLVGPGKYYDPEKYFIICANVLGSHYGSTNALSVNPETGQPYFHAFPRITIRDVVNALELLRKHLNIEKIATVIGGSLGGQQALEWLVLNPQVFDEAVLIATNAVFSAYGIAFNESQRMAVAFDPTWAEDRPDAGMKGMEVARSIALLSYRTYDTYAKTQAREPDQFFNFRASTYQNYQGEKLAKRFNAFSYYTLSNMMDSHDVARHRGPLISVLNQIQTKTKVVGITSDVLFPVHEQKFLAEHMPNAKYYEIESTYGHDGFLLEFEKLGNILSDAT